MGITIIHLSPTFVPPDMGMSPLHFSQVAFTATEFFT